MDILLLFVSLIALIILDIPMAFSIGLSSILYIFVTDLRPLMIAPQRMLAGMDHFALLAITLFLLAGNMMEQFGISKRLVKLGMVFFGRSPSSVGIIAVVCCAIFAALTGSGPATVAAIGAIMYPLMIDCGYNNMKAAGLLAMSGSLGPVIPPSIPMIVYGSTMSVSIPKMFMAAIVPGLMLAAGFIITNLIINRKKRRNSVMTEDAPAAKTNVREKLLAIWQTLGALGMPVVVLGGIYAGIFTPTEAAAISVVYSMILGLFYRELAVKKIKILLFKTVETSAKIVFIIAVATLFVWILASTRIPVKLVEAIVPIIHSKYIYILILSLILFIVGCLMDTSPSIVILAPVLSPIGEALGMDPLHLSMVFCINLIIGYATPPFGMNLFTAVSITQLDFIKVVRGTIPFLVSAIVVYFIIAFVPQLSLFLPNMIFG
jgi:C4-dicarboxylate transporter DctM subunit